MGWFSRFLTARCFAHPNRRGTRRIGYVPACRACWLFFGGGTA